MRTPVFFLILLVLAFPASPRAQAAASGNGTILRAGDVIRIEIWREPDLSGDFLINEAGQVVLPLLGKREAAGMPLDDLRDALLVEYRVQLRNPSITVTPLRRVYVLGEVNAPGLYQVDPTISLAGAIALAGGANKDGDIRRLRVIRDGDVVVSDVQAESALTSADVRSGDQIFVDRRNWFDRNSTFLISAMLSVASIVVSLSR